jgi:hypothetical protein
MPGGAISDDMCTWDVPPNEGGARRASLGDLGGAQVQDDIPSPDIGKDIYAGLVNELARQVAGINRVIGAAKVWVRVQAGNAFVFRTSGMGTSVDVNFFAVQRISPGVFQITWTAGTLPPLLGEPDTSLTSGPGMIWGLWIANNPNGVEVHTTDASGNPADQSFVVTIV